jgi:hypothetical protein
MFEIFTKGRVQEREHLDQRQLHLGGFPVQQGIKA